MMSRYVITACVTSARASVTHFTYRAQQPSFAYANDGASPVRNNNVTDERN